MKRRGLARRRGLIVAGILVFVVAAGLLVKERLALWVLDRYIQRAYPQGQVVVKGLDLGPRRAAAAAIAFKLPVGAQQVWSGRVEDLRISFDPWQAFVAPQRVLRSAEAALDRLSGPGFLLEGGVVRAGRLPGEEPLRLSVTCDRVSVYEKEISDITGRAVFSAQRLSGVDLNGTFLGGSVTVTGDASLAASSFDAKGEVFVAGLDVAQLIQALKLGERLDATGLYGGRLDVVFQDGLCRVLSGTIKNGSGGRLYVADVSLLKGAGVGQQAGNIVVENLKNYHYDRGEIVFSQEGRNVKLDFMLEGPAGSRQLEVVLHGPEEE